MLVKNIGAHTEDLASGQIVGMGETVELDQEAANDPFNKAKIDAGTFLVVEEAPTPEPAPEPAPAPEAEPAPEEAPKAEEKKPHRASRKKEE